MRNTLFFVIFLSFSSLSNAGLRCNVEPYDDAISATFIRCIVAEDNLKITDTRVNRGRCSNTQNFQLNIFNQMAIQMITRKEGSTFEDIHPNSRLGNYKFSDEFIIVTDCRNIIEFDIYTPEHTYTFK